MRRTREQILEEKAPEKTFKTTKGSATRPAASLRIFAAVFLCAGICLCSAEAQTYKVLHRFMGPDGMHPWGHLLRDSAGNLYGTTNSGGAYGYGTIFRMHGNQEAVLHSFVGGDEGGGPVTGLVRDREGNLFGSTVGFQGAGQTVFELDAKGNYTVLLSQSSTDLTIDALGNLYGTSGDQVFELDTSGKFTVLYTFPFQTDPNGGLVVTPGGAIYGTTQKGGAHARGTVFKLSKSGKETDLYAFSGGTDGSGPHAGLVRDKQGSLYGTTVVGGNANCGTQGTGCGVVFKLEARPTSSNAISGPSAMSSA